MKVVEFQRENWRNAARTLRTIADRLDSGELPPCSIGTLAMRSAGGKLEVFGFGPMADDLQALALFRLAEQKLIDVLLEQPEG